MRYLKPILLVFCLGLALEVHSSAIEPMPFRSELEEIRFKALAKEIRCTVCQNQSLADSDAPLAKDLRRELFFMIQDNRSDQEIRQFMVERYGDFVLYRPPVASHTALLWGAPIVLLMAGLIATIVVIRKRRALL
jgi:cytochrome c-type biogenesis protein CcmH